MGRRVIYLVFNAHGASCMAEGDSEAEAIENARPMFASNWIYVIPDDVDWDDGSEQPRGETVPNPAFAQVGMRAALLGERSVAS
jgi:hypothetical protein